MMERSEIEVLRLLTGGPLSIREMAARMGLSYSRTAAIVRKLVGEGYCERAGKLVGLSSNAKAILLRKLLERYDLRTLLGGSSERVILALSKATDATEIQRRTGLAQSTVYQALRRLMAMGAVRKQGDLYSLADDPDLRTFSELLARELEAKEVEPHAILIHSNHLRLKKVPAGAPARGTKTAFSLFPAYGIDYPSPHDYYVEPEHEMSIEEVLVHALRAAEGKAEATMCAIFYLKNRDRMDPARIRSLARRFGVASLWADLQNYVRGLPVRGADSFLPWDEFKEKAGLYGLQILPPPGAEKMMEVLRELGSRLDSEVHAYLFGGANLLLRGLKKATRDLDLVVGREEDFLRVRDALLRMGFEPLARERLAPADRKLNPGDIYVSEGRPRIDLFTGVICGALSLTEGMRRRAETMVFGKLVLHLLSLEDVFLLKSITEREGDLEDMAAILRHGELRWDEMLETYFEEERVMRRHLCFTLLDNLELLLQREGIAVPIHGRLLRHCLEVGILQALARGATTVREIRGLVDFPEHAIRNRIGKLVKEGKIVKRRRGGRLFLVLTERGRESLFESQQPPGLKS